GEVQPHVPASIVPVSIGRIEAVSRNKRNVFSERGAQERLRVRPLGHGHPQEKTTLGMSPGDFGGEKLLQGMQHGIAPLAVDLANQLDMLVEEAIPGNFEGHILVEGGGMQVSRLLELNQFADYRSEERRVGKEWSSPGGTWSA